MIKAIHGKEKGSKKIRITPFRHDLIKQIGDSFKKSINIKSCTIKLRKRVDIFPKKLGLRNMISIRVGIKEMNSKE